MSFTTSKTLLAALTGAATVVAHGHVNAMVADGSLYQGWDTDSMPYMDESARPVIAAWSTTVTDNGFVSPAEFGSEDIICHKGAAPGKGHAVVAAGGEVSLQWNTWPESHHGPVIDYLASCGDSGCESVEPASLEFFKIGESGLLDGSTSPGTWGDDTLMSNNNSWIVKIPSTLKAGNYVLRHELIALHSAQSEGGAQNYPQCFNLQVTGGGDLVPTGVAGTSLYTSTEEGIVFDIYKTNTAYPVPGPDLIDGAESAEQSVMPVTATSTAITGSATGAPAAGASSSSAPAAGGAEPTSSSAADVSAPTASAPAAGVSTTAVQSAAATTAPSASSPAQAQPEPAAPSATKKPSCSGTISKRRHARDVKMV